MSVGIKVGAKTHAKLSPSSSNRWMTCPASVRAIESLDVVDKPSKFAAEGTAAHELHEMCLKEAKNLAQFIRTPEHYRDTLITVEGMEFTVNSDMIESVQKSLDYIYDRMIEADLDGLDVETHVEVRSSLTHLGIPGLDGGTSDVVMVFREKKKYDIVAIEILDYKHGKGVAVDCVDNSQALCYAVGVVDHYCRDYEAINVDVRITIAQPRAYHPDGPIRHWDTNAHDVKLWRSYKLIPAAVATLSPDPHFKASEEGCRFCPMSGNCPAQYRATQAIARSEFADFTSDDMASDDMADVQTLTPDQKIFILDKATVIRQFLSAVEDQVKSELDQGSTDYAEHYKLVKKRSQRKIRDDHDPLFEYLDHDDVYTFKVRSLSEIEKVLRAKAGSKEAKEIMNACTFKTDPQLVLAHISDKREAQDPSLVSDFNDMVIDHD